MKKIFMTLLFAVLFAAGLTGYALADVAAGPIVAVSIGVPLLIAAAAVIVIVAVVKAVRKKSAKSKSWDEPKDKS